MPGHQKHCRYLGVDNRRRGSQSGPQGIAAGKSIGGKIGVEGIAQVALVRIGRGDLQGQKGERAIDCTAVFETVPVAVGPGQAPVVDRKADQHHARLLQVFNGFAARLALGEQFHQGNTATGQDADDDHHHGDFQQRKPALIP